MLSVLCIRYLLKMQIPDFFQAGFFWSKLLYIRENTKESTFRWIDTEHRNIFVIDVE